MESFGAYLRSLREQNGKTLEQLSNSTKIAATNLDFLENDRYDLLPPKVFVKGFIRSYVRELGLDPEEVISKFDDFVRNGEMPDFSDNESSILINEPSKSSFIFNPWFTRILTFAGMISLGILILTGVTRLFYAPQTPSENVLGRDQASSSHKALRQDSRPEMSQKNLSDSQQPKAGKKTLEIKASGNAWVRVAPDGGPAEEFNMAPGDVEIFYANKSFSLMTGNAGGIRIRFDGKVLQPLGKNNQTLSLTLP